MLVQTHYWPSYSILVFFAAVAALGLITNRLGLKGDRLYAVIWEVTLAVIWAPVMLWGWTMLRQAKPADGAQKPADGAQKVAPSEDAHVATSRRPLSSREELPRRPYEALG